MRGLLALLPGIALRYPIKKWAAVMAVAAAFGYALMAGATVPTMRAFLMIALVLVAILLDRRGISMRLVEWAALVVLVLHPESLLGASFQMSFAAVVGLIAAYELAGPRIATVRRGSGPVRRLWLYVAGVLLTTLVAGLATAPFAAFNFNRMADYSLAANLVAVPVTAMWIMPAGVVSFLLMPFGWEEAALVPMGWGVGVVLEVARTVAGWPGAVTLLPAMPVWGIVLVTFGGLWLCLWQRSCRL
jgi:competence protein ComEC